jgi:phosphopantothenoylcysteine decarboxylase/phosphopantothenate--cysteine ligase
MLNGKRILLIISGGIAAYKALELIRALKKSGASVRCILTKGGAQFVTPLSVAALTEEAVYDDLWSLKDETEMGHIRLSREADLVVVAPASANLIAQMAHGLAEDLASTTLLATNRPVMICPAMNPMMWQHEATQTNIDTLRKRDIQIVEPADGDMACGETGTGRLPEAENILEQIISHFQNNKPLAGKRALVTSGPTYEPIDPVRFIGNRSSGKQGHAIAKALSDAGASVTLVTGPVHIDDPDGVQTIHVETAHEMLWGCQNSLPVDIAICAAAVSDWRVKETAENKIKKGDNQTPPALALEENQDILKTIATHQDRPELVIGFAAETENLIENAKSKLTKKSCDWVLANNVAETDIFGTDENHVYLVTNQNVTEWPKTDKETIARDLVQEIINHYQNENILNAAE